MRIEARLPMVCLFSTLLFGGCGGGGGGGSSTPSAEEQSAQRTSEAKTNLDDQSSQGLAQALALLEEAVDLDPANDEARMLLGAIRLPAFLDDNRFDPSPTTLGGEGEGSTLAHLLARAGIDLHGDSIFDFLEGTADPIGTPEELSDDTPTLGELQTLVRDELLPVLRAAEADLSAVSEDFSRSIDLFGRTIELDYGDAEVLAAGLRALEVQLLLFVIFDLDADLDALANYDKGGAPLDHPYRLFTGESPDDIVEHARSRPLPGEPERSGFLNEPDTLASRRTFRPAAGADELFDDLRVALISLVKHAQAGAAYEEDADSSDDLFVVTGEDACEISLAEPWLLDLLDALQGGDPVVDAFATGGGDCELALPGFTLDIDLVFDPKTYDGRPFLPDYGGSKYTVADEGSFDHATGATDLNRMIQDLGGDPLSAAELLGSWNALNQAWDVLFAGEPLESAY